MDKERLKKLLATFSLATLLSGAGVTTVGDRAAEEQNPAQVAPKGKRRKPARQDEAEPSPVQLALKRKNRAR